MRVVQVMAGAQPGGAEAYFCRLMALDWARMGVHQLVVVRSGSWAAAELSRLGVPHATASFRGWWDLWSRWRLRRILQSSFGGQGPNVVVAWMNRAAAALPRGQWPSVGRLGGYYDLKHYRGLTGLVVNTPDLKRHVLASGWMGEVQLVPNFVPLPQEQKENQGALRHAQRVEQRLKWGVPEDAKLALLAARLHSVKGIDLALQALAKLPPEFWLVVAGEGPEQEHLHRLAKQLGVADRVVWVGWTNPLTHAAAAADVWLVPSRKEPLGNSVLDALAHGVPAVASQTPGPSWLLTDGVNGRLVPVGDVAALAEAWHQACTRPELTKAWVSAGLARSAEFSAPLVQAAWVAYLERIQTESGKPKISLNNISECQPK